MPRGREAIRQWAHIRIRTSECGWTKDAMSCILCAMENREPRLWCHDNPEIEEEYLVLAFLACECVKATQNVRGAFDLGYRLAEDFQRLPKEYRGGELVIWADYLLPGIWQRIT